MGYIRHNAIVVTSWNEDSIKSATNKAREIGLQVLGPSEPLVNGYSSILICPDGSKEGWTESGEGDERRSSFREWLTEQEYEDGSTNLDWVEVEYDEEGTGSVLRVR